MCQDKSLQIHTAGQDYKPHLADVVQRWLPNPCRLFYPAILEGLYSLICPQYENFKTRFVMSFSTDTPPLFFEMEGVQEVSLALGHDEPVSIGCPLYNEASAVKGCLVLSSNVIAQRLN